LHWTFPQFQYHIWLHLDCISIGPFPVSILHLPHSSSCSLHTVVFDPAHCNTTVGSIYIMRVAAVDPHASQRHIAAHVSPHCRTATLWFTYTTASLRRHPQHDCPALAARYIATPPSLHRGFDTTQPRETSSQPHTASLLPLHRYHRPLPNFI